MNLGTKIKNLRIKKDLTQAELGQILALDSSTISLYESGKREPDYETLNKLADFFDVSIDYLMGRNRTATTSPTLGERIKQLRSNCNLTQEELAKILDIPRGSIANWELDRGIPEPQTLGKIARFFNVSLDYLLLGWNPYVSEQPALDNSISPDITKGLTNEEKKQVEQFIMFIKSQRKDEQSAAVSGQ